MPLTRHFYELDEVVSALQTCLHNGWPRAPFWTWELFVSDEIPLLRRTLRDCWLHHSGGVDPMVLQRLNVNDPDWLTITLRIAAAIRESRKLSAAVVLTDIATIPFREYVTPLPRTSAAAVRRRTRAAAFVATLDAAEELSATEATNWWISYDSACRSGRRRDAAWLLQAASHRLSTDALWSAVTVAVRGGLREALASIHAAVADDLHPTTQLLALTNATLLLAAQGDDERSAMLAPPQPPQQPFWVRTWASWEAIRGRRAARVYDVPTDALHAGTPRGSMSRKFTNIDEVREPVVLLTEGCAFWRAATAAAGIHEDADTGAILFSSDEDLEAFYDRYFPDDIPDEWSRADQERSHGRGCAESAPPAPADPPQWEEPCSESTWRRAIGCRQHPPKKLTRVRASGGTVSDK